MSSYKNKPFVPPVKKACLIPTKDADLERLLERLDRITRDVEQVADHIAERLGLELSDDGGDTEELDSEEEVDSEKLSEVSSAK
ncbi:MAG: S-methyltransferase subunit G [Cressdnaviricota sp.]|nr:MAG: S-methyltransferase subunit G [Cressdnaviricota sp.]